MCSFYAVRVWVEVFLSRFGMEHIVKVVLSGSSDALAHCLDVNQSLPRAGAAASCGTVTPLRYAAQIL